MFGEPFEKNGVTIIPVATVMGGGGGGEGPVSDEDGGGSGSGGGFGLNARPIGIYVIRGDRVEWEETTDRTRVMLGWQIVATLSVLALRSMFKQRSKTRRRRG